MPNSTALQNLERLRADLPLFAERCLKICGKSGEIIPLRLNRAQLHVHQRLEAQRARTGKVRALILKARQQGFSTYIGARFYHRAALNRGQRVFILTHDKAATENLFSMVYDPLADAARVYWHEKGATADGSALPWRIESADFYLDPNVESLVTEAWPDIDGDQIGPVMLTLTTRPYPQSSQASVFGPYAMAPGQSVVSFKAAGRLGRLTYEGYSAPSYARLGRMVLDVKPRGRRA